MVDFQACIRAARASQATDLLLAPGLPPGVRVRGTLRFLHESGPLSREDLESLLDELPAGADDDDAGDRTTVVSPDPGGPSLRLSVSRGLHGPVLAARLLPESVPALEDLHLPALLNRVPSMEQGLVLVIGCAGQGKSTTLAAILDAVNRTRSRQVFTLENPVEFRHGNRRSRILQTRWEGRGHASRVLGSAAFQRRNDLVVLDGLPRADTASLAMEAAARGRLVVAALASGGGVAETLKGLIDLNPAPRRDPARRLLARTLKMALWQHLLPRRDGSGCTPACELLVNDPVTAELIRKPGRLHLLRPTMAAARPYGMQTMRQALADLRRERRVSEADLRTFEESVYTRVVLPVQSPF